MQINRFDLIDAGISKSDTAFILKKARNHKSVECVEKMVLCPYNMYRYILFFDIEQFIIAQQKVIKTIRIDCVKRNKEVLEMVTNAKKIIYNKIDLILD